MDIFPCTVADEIEFEKLPIELQELAIRVVKHRLGPAINGVVFDPVEIYTRGFEDGQDSVYIPEPEYDSCPSSDQILSILKKR